MMVAKSLDHLSMHRQGNISIETGRGNQVRLAPYGPEQIKLLQGAI
jgi:hypothetical protein